MKLNPYIFSILLLISQGISAQKVDQHVTVERNYKPVIQDAGKITSLPRVVESATEKLPADYADINLLLPVSQNIHTLDAANVSFNQNVEEDNMFAKAGIGNYFNNLVEIALPLVKQPGTKLDFHLNHLATFGNEAHSTSNASLKFDKIFKKADLFAGANFGYEYLKYYGDNFDKQGNVIQLSDLSTSGSTLYKESNFTKVTTNAGVYSLNDLINATGSNSFVRLHAYAGLRSLPFSSATRYNTEVGYKIFNSINGLTENMIDVKGNFNTISSGNHLGIDVEFQNMKYGSNLSSIPINIWDAYSVFTLNPYYSFEYENWDLRLGARSSFSFVHGRPFNPSPDIKAEWKIAPKWLSIYGGTGGGYQINTLDKMSKENRYLFPNLRIKDTYTPFNGYFGIKLKPAHNILINAYANYKYIDNQYFFINKTYAYSPTSATMLASQNDSVLSTNRFNVVYSSATQLKAGASINYHLKNIVDLQLNGVYNKWNVYDITTAWNMPTWEASMNAFVHVSNKLDLTSAVYYESERKAKVGETTKTLNPLVDLNLGANYAYSEQIEFFLKANNLLNDRYEEYAGYKVQGINFLLGATFSF